MQITTEKSRQVLRAEIRKSAQHHAQFAEAEGGIPTRRARRAYARYLVRVTMRGRARSAAHAP